MNHMADRYTRIPVDLPASEEWAAKLDIFTHRKDVQLRMYYEPQEGLFLAESAMVIERALDAGYLPESVLADEAFLRSDAAAVLERCGNIPVYTTPAGELKQITGYNVTRGVLCAMRRRPLPAPEEICRHARRIAVLENVMNPTNVGAIFRSAAAMGIDALLLTTDCGDPLYRRALRVSVGTVFQIPWTFIPDIRQLRKYGFKTAAMALETDTISIEDERLRQEEKLAVLLGSEGYGLRPETIAESDYKVMIPMRPGVDSLNVAAASAVAFWELRR